MANEKVYVGETGIKEFYRKIKQLINNFGGYEEATGTGDDNHPDVANPSTKIIYLVPVQDGSTPNLYEEWFWHVNETTHVGNWELFGKTTFTENSWKHWSEQNGSTSADSTGTSVYIGRQNTITAGPYGDNYVIGAENTLKNGFIFGKSNTASDRTALIIGTSNTSTSYDQIILGNNNSDAGYTTALVGYNNTIAASVHDSSVFGSENSLKVKSWSTQASTMHGRGNVAEDFYISDMFGSNNQSYLDKQSGIYAKDSHTERNYLTSIFGQSITATDNRLSAIFGYSNTVSKMFESVVIGAAVNASGISSNAEGSSNVIIGASSGSVNVKASNSALVLSYSNVFGSYNAIIGTNSDIGDPSIEGSNGQSDTNSGIAGFSSRVRPKSNNNLFVMSYETLSGSRNVDINQFGKTVGDSNINIGGYNSIGDNAYATTPTSRSYNIAIGQSNNIQRDNSILIGKSNSASFDDNTDYSDSYVTAFGQSNTAANAANAYQIGQNNSVTGNNLDLISNYPHQTAVNLGVYNAITKEGVNIGKDNVATNYGINLGRNNESSNDSISIGRYSYSTGGSIVIGKGDYHTAGTTKVNDWVYADGNSIAIGIGQLRATSTGVAIGLDFSDVNGHSMGVGLFSRNQYSKTNIAGGSAGFVADGAGDNGGYGASNIGGGSIGFGAALTLNGGAFAAGISNNVTGGANTFGRYNSSTGGSTVVGTVNSNIDSGSHVFGYGNSFVERGSVVCGLSCRYIGTGFTLDNSYIQPNGANNVIGTRNAYITGGINVLGNDSQYIYSGASSIGNNNQYIHDGSWVFGDELNHVYSGAVAIGRQCNNIHNSGWALGNALQNVYNDGIAIGDTITNVYTGSVAIGYDLNNIWTNAVNIGIKNNMVAETSIAIGTSNFNVQHGSVALGMSNTGFRGAFIIGMNNTAYVSQYASTFHTNAAILGFDNRVCNIREKFKCAYDSSQNLTYQLVCGFIAGSNNHAYGHNPIAIGVGNTVGDDSAWYNDVVQALDPSVETDNDGFMTAIGYKCEALRNYDMAIGYMSKAKGGENIAINASSAIGFTNIAINHSEIKGVGNIGILESRLVTPIENIYKRGEYYDDEAYNVHNLLFHSNLYHSTDEIYGPDDTEHSPNYRAFQLIDNICIHSNSALIGGSGALFNGNLFAMDDGLTISSPNASNNIIWKMHTANNTQSYGDNIVATGDVCRNMSIGSELSINGIQYYTNNVSLGESKIRLQGMTGAVKMDSNFLFKGNITGSDFGAPNREYAINNNVVMSTSLLDLNYDNTIDSCTFNMVLNGSGLHTENTKAYWNGSDNQCSKSNVLFGTYGFGLLGCFSHSDTKSALLGSSVQLIDTYSATFDRMLFDMSVDTLDVDNAFLRNARLATNFGDNALKNINTALVTGESNWVLGVRSAVVHGNKNTVINTDETIHPMNSMPYVTVIGNDNRIKNSGHGSYFSHNWIEGNSNWVYGSKIADTRIHGTRNIISSLDEQNIPVLTPAEVMALQTQYKTDSSGLSCGVFIAAQDGYVYQYNTSGTETTTSIYEGSAYRFTKVLNAGWQQVGLNCGYLNNLAYGNLGYKKLYAPSTFDNAHDVYRLTIFGEENSVNSRVAGYSIFGSGNTLRNTLFPNDSDFCIGNGFIQGNDNTVQDGSNIISMGNGNTSIGHNSVAIGSQLKSNQWQTVIGKYNKEIAGPSRIMSSFNPSAVYGSGDVVFYAPNNAYYEYTAPQSSSGVWDPSKWTETHPEEDKALFIIGNGYSETDGRNWLDESNIHRSNAMEVYADGTVKARRFISDEPDLELTEGTGIQISKNVTAGTLTVSVKQPLPAAPSGPGTYALQCVVDVSGNPTYSWVAIGTATV